MPEQPELSSAVTSTSHTFDVHQPTWTYWKPHTEMGTPLVFDADEYHRLGDRLNELIIADMAAFNTHQQGLIELALAEGLLDVDDLREAAGIEVETETDVDDTSESNSNDDSDAKERE